MPEGDAVRRTAHRLDRALAGHVLRASDFRVPQLATADLSGGTVLRTRTHGKHLLTRVKMPDGRRLTIHTHLRMEGRWRTVRPGGRLPGPPADIRLVLRTDAATMVGLRLGVVELLDTADEHEVIGHLGPDLLGPWEAADRAEAIERLTADPRRVLGDALLDQRVVAGIGTIWLAESCFVGGICPLARVADLPDPGRFLDRVRVMLQAAVRQREPVTTGDPRDPLWAFRRNRQPCKRCGTIVLAGRVGPPDKVRTTYWCPHCQPTPADVTPDQLLRVAPGAPRSPYRD